MFGLVAFALGIIDPWWGPEVAESIARVPAVTEDWERMLGETPEAMRGDIAYLITYLPEGDLMDVEPEELLENVELAQAARAAVPWGDGLPQDIYLEAVLPHRSATEPFQPMRREFYEKYLPLVEDANTPGEAALRVNAQLFKDYGVTYNTGRMRTDQNSHETIAQGMATCTGLSIMYVEACRALAIPSRIAGIAAWPGRGGNHTWAEVWSDGWHFVGAAEPDQRGLNHAWFVGDAATAIHDEPLHAVWATAYRGTGEHFPLAWNMEARVPGVNVTDRYAGEREDTRPRLMVEVRDTDGRIEVPVKAFSMKTGGLVLGGMSLGMEADMNLHLNEHVDSGEYLVLAFVNGERIGTVATVGDTDEVVGIVADVAGDPLGEVLERRFGHDGAARDAAAKILDAIPYSEEDHDLAWEKFLTAPQHEELREQFDEKVVRTSNRESPYLWRHVGKKPEDGWGLVIAMHGGGATATEFNDRAWRSMFDSYYRDHPEAGGYIYLALRAPNDEWNGFYDDAISPLVEELIFQFVRFADVDPSAVYILGASHGGYGAFAIGPKIPYRFAAVHASAAAPTDGVTRGQNLRNTPFTWMIGENDTAFGRDWRCQAFAEKWSEWQEMYGGFVGGMEWLPGVGHSVPDRDKVRDLLEIGKRDAHPKRLVWALSDAVIRDFFWIEVPAPANGSILEAKIVGNRIELTLEGVDELALWLRNELVDFSEIVTVVIDDEEHQFVLLPTLEVFCQGLEQRRDPELAAPVRLVLSDFRVSVKDR